MLTPTALPQHFLGSDMMEDGQVAGRFQPDRSEEDREDLEHVAPLDSEATAKMASHDAGRKTKDSNSPLQRFLDEWSDDASDPNSGYGADSHPKNKKGPRSAPKSMPPPPKLLLARLPRRYL